MFCITQIVIPTLILFFCGIYSLAVCVKSASAGTAAVLWDQPLNAIQVMYPDDEVDEVDGCFPE